MNDFLQTAFTFPTVVYSVLLAVCALYWLLAATGLADGDGIEAPGDGDAGEATGAAAMLAWLGLAGVPLMVVLTTFAFTAWAGTYFVHLLSLGGLADGARTVAGWATMIGMLVPAVAATSLVLRPLSRGIARLRASAPDTSLLGRSGVVITPTLTASYGQVAVDDGGAGLVLQVRHDDPNQLKRGDRIVLIEYIEGQNAYRVVPEQQFLSR